MAAKAHSATQGASAEKKKKQNKTTKNKKKKKKNNNKKTNFKRLILLNGWNDFTGMFFGRSSIKTVQVVPLYRTRWSQELKTEKKKKKKKKKKYFFL